MKIIFLGTPDYASTVLEAIQKSQHQIVAVVCQPDREIGRGKKVAFSPVKTLAQANGLPIYQFEKISRDGVETLKELNADIMVTAAYGQILSREVLGLCKYGVINAHGSLLPKYRGSSPVQSALLNGEEEVGVTVMQTEYEVDSGDIILKKSIKLKGNENAEETMSILANIAGDAVVEALDKIEDGTATYSKQDANQATFCKKLSKDDGKIDFSDSAINIKNKIRAFTPWPSVFCVSPYGRLKILSADTMDVEHDGVFGEILEETKNYITIACGKGVLIPILVQGENAKAMDIASYIRGHKLEKGTILK